VSSDERPEYAFSVALDTVRVELSEGFSVEDCGIRIRNEGTRRDSYRIELRVPPVVAAKLRHDEVVLDPDSDTDVTIGLSLVPHAPIPPTPLAFEVRVTSAGEPGLTHIAGADIKVSRQAAIAATMTPPVVRRPVGATFLLTLTNHGRTGLQGPVSAVDPTGRLTLTATPAFVRVEPGASVQVTVTANARPAVPGEPKRVPFQVTFTPTGVPPAQATGMIAPPRLPQPSARSLGIGAAVLATAIIAFALISSAGNDSQKLEAVRATTAPTRPGTTTMLQSPTTGGVAVTAAPTGTGAGATTPRATTKPTPPGTATPTRPVTPTAPPTPGGVPLTPPARAEPATPGTSQWPHFLYIHVAERSSATRIIIEAGYAGLRWSSQPGVAAGDYLVRIDETGYVRSLDGQLAFWRLPVSSRGLVVLIDSPGRTGQDRFPFDHEAQPMKASTPSRVSSSNTVVDGQPTTYSWRLPLDFEIVVAKQCRPNQFLQIIPGWGSPTTAWRTPDGTPVGRYRVRLNADLSVVSLDGKTRFDPVPAAAQDQNQPHLTVSIVHSCDPAGDGADTSGFDRAADSSIAHQTTWAQAPPFDAGYGWLPLHGVAAEPRESFAGCNYIVLTFAAPSEAIAANPSCG
jgi:hypothetical protein